MIKMIRRIAVNPEAEHKLFHFQQYFFALKALRSLLRQIKYDYIYFMFSIQAQ